MRHRFRRSVRLARPRFLRRLVALACCLGCLGKAATAQVLAPPGFQTLQYADLLRNVYRGSVVVADFDQRRFGGERPDRMDLFMSGLRAPLALDPAANLPFSAVYTHQTTIVIDDPGAPPREEWAYRRNTGPFRQVFYSDVAVSDYDADGDVDLLFLGATTGGAPFEPVTLLYQNNGDVDVRFNGVDAGFVGVHHGSADWGDFDHDGAPDLLLTGVAREGFVTRLYRNLGAGVFEDVPLGVEDVGYGDAAWGDYDGDLDLDLVITGITQPERFISKVYRNDEGRFVDAGVALPGLAFSKVAWFDYDSDGRPDILLSGGFLNPFIMEGRTAVFQNLGDGQFREVEVEGEGAFDGRLAVGDYDSDGDADFVVSGWQRAAGNLFTRMYRNDGDAFRIDYSIQQTVSSAFALADFDRDDDLDLFITGFNPDASGLFPPFTQFYVNQRPGNAPPTVPSGLQATVDDQAVTFSWNVASDSRTPAPGLTYNLRVGTFPGGSDVVSPLADGQTGQRRVSAPGNAGSSTLGRLTLPAGAYYWSVQALDASYAASPFAPEQFVTTGDPDDTTPPEAPRNLFVAAGDAHVVLAWQPNTEPDLAQYRVYRSTTPGAATLLVGVEARATQHIDLDVEIETTYYYRLTAVDASGNESPFSQEVSATPRQVFTRDAAWFTDIRDVAWGDYDSDGNLDLLLANSRGEQVWRNVRFPGGEQEWRSVRFFRPAGLRVSNGTVAWGDYENDGDLDVLIAGTLGSFGQPVALLIRNEGLRFAESNEVVLLGIERGDAAWGDYDNDGDLDLLLAGRTAFGDTTQVYRNDGGIFKDAQVGLPSVSNGSAAWGDYDGDGDLDLLLAGSGLARVYRNEEGRFTDSGVRLPGVTNSAAAWGDYDGDGDLDLLISGNNVSTLTAITRLYRQEDGTFTEVAAGLPGVTGGAVAWGDGDGDGDLDLVLAGRGQGGPLTRIYLNDRGALRELGATFEAVSNGAVAWGDYDGDGDLDLLISGNTTSENITRIYRNDMDRANTAPTPPGSLSGTVSGATVTLRWEAASDAETPQPGLTYNLRIGTAPGSADVLSPMADPESGLRRVPGFGNAFHNTTWLISNLAPGTYYWSVQAVDFGFAGSPFAPEATFTITGLDKEGTATSAGAPDEMPDRPALRPGYPNPFRERTLIRLALPTDAPVRLVVYDAMGRRVRTLVDGLEPAGEKEVTWDGRGDAGEQVASGVYFFRLEVKGGPVLTQTTTRIH